MSSKTGVKDRRLHARLATTLSVQGSGKDGIVARMVARNLSLGGLYCSSTVDFPEMTRLAVRLMLPLRGETEPVPLDVEAVVVRREAVPDTAGNEQYDLALYFTRIDGTARDCLRRFLSADDIGDA